MYVRRLILFVGLVVVFSMPVRASTILTLSPVGAHEVGPQSASNPCVIAATTCQQPAGFGYNNYVETGAISTYDMWSTTPEGTVAEGVQGTPYTVAQLPYQSFLVAIDVNTTSEAGETLQLFEVIDVTTGNTVLASYTGPGAIGGVSNNGNGYADWTLGTVSLAGLAPSDQILFHAKWTGASDGGESFFLVPNVTVQEVPEPNVLVMLGAGLAGLLGLVRIKRLA